MKANVKPTKIKCKFIKDKAYPSFYPEPKGDNYLKFLNESCDTEEVLALSLSKASNILLLFILILSLATVIL